MRTFKKLKSFLLFFLCIVFTGISQSTVSPKHIDYFKNELKYGPNPVGYKHLLVNDPGRPSLHPPKNKNDKIYGREMELNIWYPAVHSSSSQMLYKDYILVSNQAFTGKESRELFFNTIKDLSGDTSLFTAIYEDLINNKTKAFKNAPVSKGIFPLIIYPDLVYGQSILSEYLASHGFIIVSPVIKGTFAEPMEYTVQGIETAVEDLQFALGYMRSHYSIKKEFGTMGIGFNATVGLALQLRNKDNLALVSLEGGITTPFETDLIRKSPYFNIQELSKAMLILYAPHPDVKPELTYTYKYADRFYQYYLQSSEFYFLNYGIWEKDIKNIFPKAIKGNTWRSYELASGSILDFFKWNLIHEDNSRINLLNTPGIPGMVETTYKPGARLPFSNEELFLKIKSGKIDSIKIWLEESKKKDPLPFSFNNYFTISQSLIRESNFNGLLDWAKLFEIDFPLSAVPFSLLGRANLELGNKAEANKLYRKALSLIENDHELDEVEKSTYKSAIETRIKGSND